MTDSMRTLRTTRVDADGVRDSDDVVAIEEPLEIRVADKPVSVTMRTPGDDFDLAAGFLFTEGIIGDARDIEGVRHWGSPNVVRVALRDGVRVDWEKLQRHFYATSSCGVCGKASIDALRTHAAPITSDVRIAASLLASLPDRLREEQRAFDATGAVHAAALFSADGTLLRAREDVGRHNAVDKVIGSLLFEAPQTSPDVLVVSSRASFEVVQKAIVARIPIIASVGAPSSLAVELAEELGATLCGFVRDGRFNVYANAQRIASGVELH